MTKLQKKISEYKIMGEGKANFFDEDTLEAWSSEIHEPLVNDRYFITSEPDAFGEGRYFTVREFYECSDGEHIGIRSASEFLEFSTYEEALECAEGLN